MMREMRAIGIELHGVELSRRIPSEHTLDLKRTLFALVRGRYKAAERRRILKNVSLTVDAGERVGIIGANGSGKSTLLKVIAGILRPNAGEVRIDGSVAPLIELGAGFDPELSLYDNIVLYGVLLGHGAARMAKRADEILAFAELADQRDVPAKTLSSGLLARLGFAVATDVRPDILLLDEVFAVGDEAFRQKSYARIQGYTSDRTAVLIVSHDLAFMEQWCSRTICVQNGRIAFDGNPAAAIRFYLDTFDLRLPAYN